MQQLSWAQKYSTRTTDLYVRISTIGMVGFGFLILAHLTALALRPRFTAAYVWAWATIGVIMTGALVCAAAMCITLVRFFKSARIDRQRRKAGLPVNPDVQG